MGRKPTLESAKKPTIQITTEAKDRFVKWLGTQRNPHQGQTVAAILDWFNDQPALVQQVVLRQFPEEMKVAYAKALEAMAQRVRAGKEDGLTGHVAGSGKTKIV